jgi:hypothetical protein
MSNAMLPTSFMKTMATTAVMNINGLSRNYKNAKTLEE